VTKHWAIDLIEQIVPDLDGVIRADAEDVRVVSRVVNLAERQPIRDDRQTLLFRIRNDVSSVQQRAVVQHAHCASVRIGQHHTTSEQWLVQSATCLGQQVPAKCSFYPAIEVDVKLVSSQRKDELVLLGFLLQQIDRGDDIEHAWCHADEPHKGRFLAHCLAQRLVFGRPALICAQLVPVQAVWTLMIVIRRHSRLRRGSEDRQRGRPTCRLSDTAAAID